MQRFERVPHGRYINFVADFLEADKTTTRAEAIAAWKELNGTEVLTGPYHKEHEGVAVPPEPPPARYGSVLEKFRPHNQSP